MLLLNELEPFSEWVSNIGHGGRGTERSRKREARDRSREREREKERPSWPADRTKAKKEREDRWRRPWKEETKRSYLTRFTFTAIDSYFFFALPLSFLIHVLFFSEFWHCSWNVWKIYVSTSKLLETLPLTWKLDIYITLIERMLQPCRNSLYEFSIRSLPFLLLFPPFFAFGKTLFRNVVPRWRFHHWIFYDCFIVLSSLERK